MLTHPQFPRPVRVAPEPGKICGARSYGFIARLSFRKNSVPRRHEALNVSRLSRKMKSQSVVCIAAIQTVMHLAAGA